MFSQAANAHTHQHRSTPCNRRRRLPCQCNGEMRRTLVALQLTSARLQAGPTACNARSIAAWQGCMRQASADARPPQTVSSGSCGTAQRSPSRGFAAHAAADRPQEPLPRPLPRPRRLGPPLGRAALPGHGQGSVNAAMAEAPPQYTVLPSPITAPYPKVRCA